MGSLGCVLKLSVPERLRLHAYVIRVIIPRHSLALPMRSERSVESCGQFSATGINAVGQRRTLGPMWTNTACPSAYRAHEGLY